MFFSKKILKNVIGNANSFFELKTTIIFYLAEMLYLMGSSALPQEHKT